LNPFSFRNVLFPSFAAESSLTLFDRFR